MFSNLEKSDMFGKVDFQIKDSKIYTITEASTIIEDWINCLINGIKSEHPFCLTTYTNKGRIICTLSYERCHMVLENDHCEPVYHEQLFVENEYCYINPLEFAKELINDIEKNIDDWIKCTTYDGSNFNDNKTICLNRLKTLKRFIKRYEDVY